MEFFNQILGIKDDKALFYEDFWNWFTQNAQSFFVKIQSGDNINNELSKKLAPILSEFKDGFFFIAGMANENTAELIFTPDGVVKNVVFVEELVKAAPSIPNWNFTALKPAFKNTNISIQMGQYSFDQNTLSFYPIEDKNHPDEIEIVIVHNQYKEEDKATILNGVLVYLDNYLGELYSITTIDHITVVSLEQAEQGLIPITKLKSYLNWREKEFVEKYDEVRFNTQHDNFVGLEATLNNGRPLLAIINRTLLDWDSKASHPWVLEIEVKYNGDHNEGMPDKETFMLLNQLEDDIMFDLFDFQGYLNIGRQTADNRRVIYFACKDFRAPSKVLTHLAKEYADRLEITFNIYKDKYWQSFERFRAN